MAKKAKQATEDMAGAAEELVTMAEAIEMLKTTRATFNRWLKAGKIRGMKVGRQWRFSRAEIERFLKGEEPRVEATTGMGRLFDALNARFHEMTGKDFQSKGDVAATQLLVVHLAVRMRASDIHIEPRAHADPAVQREHEGDEASIRFRIDGVLQAIATFDMRLLPAVISRWKIMANCDVRERIRPQDGRVVLRIGADDLPERDYDLRVCFLSGALGECMTARLLDTDVASLSLERLGFDSHDLRRVHRVLHAPWGLLLVTGPTGSGKTTTLYSCLNEIVQPGLKVMSLEDPVEYLIPGVVQVPVRRDAGITFASGLRYFLRSDPDVILVGEIRDRGALEVCLQAALTGHLVLTALHANSAAGALQRMLDIGAVPFLVADATKVIIAQRIVRVVCPHCSEPARPPEEVLQRAREETAGSGLDWPSLPGDFRRAVGCPKCAKTGYSYRIGIVETLEVTPEISKGLREGAEPQELLAIAVSQGMTTMAVDGIRKAAEGRTTISEVLRVLALR